MKYSQHVDHVMWSLLEHMYDMYPAQGGTHKPCGQSSGRGVSEKTMFVHIWGREGLEACPRGQKCITATYPFCAHEFKCPFGVTI